MNVNSFLKSAAQLVKGNQLLHDFDLLRTDQVAATHSNGGGGTATNGPIPISSTGTDPSNVKVTLKTAKPFGQGGPGTWFSESDPPYFDILCMHHLIEH